MMLTIRGQQALTVTYTLHFERKGGPEEMKTISLYLNSFIQQYSNHAERHPRPEEQTQFYHNDMQMETLITPTGSSQQHTGTLSER